MRVASQHPPKTGPFLGYRQAHHIKVLISPASWCVCEALPIGHFLEQLWFQHFGRVILCLELQQLSKLGVHSPDTTLGVGEGTLKVLTPANNEQQHFCLAQHEQGVQQPARIANLYQRGMKQKDVHCMLTG